MVTAAVQDAPFRMGRVVERAVDVIKKNLVPFFLLSAVAQAPLVAFLIVLSSKSTALTSKDPVQILGYVGTALVGGVGWMVLAFVFQAAVVHGTVAELTGKRATLQEMFRTGLREFFPLIAIAILTSAGFFLGLILLIVPGVMIILAWSVVVPARVVEHQPIFETFGRSAELTRGHRWSILGLYIVLGILSSVAGTVVAPLQSADFVGSAEAATVVYAVASGAVRAVTSVASASITASLYYELRCAKEGIGPEQLASVFD